MFSRLTHTVLNILQLTVDCMAWLSIELFRQSGYASHGDLDFLLPSAASIKRHSVLSIEPNSRLFKNHVSTKSLQVVG